MFAKLKNLLVATVVELAAQGKMLVGYGILAAPGISDYPMLGAAIKAVVVAPTKENVIALAGQSVLALGAALRAGKVVAGISGRL